MKMLEEEHIPFFLVDESGVWCGSQQQHTLLEEGISQAVTLCRENSSSILVFLQSIWRHAFFPKVGPFFPSAGRKSSSGSASSMRFSSKGHFC